MGNKMANDTGFKFTKHELKQLYSNFVSLDTNNSGLLEPNEFFDVPELKDNPIVQRVIQAFDKNGDGKISFYEFVSGLSYLNDNSSQDDKFKFAFQMYDMNGDGYLSNGDLFWALKLFAADNLSDVQIQQIVDRTLIRADKDQDGLISYQEFVDFVKNMKVVELFSMTLFEKEEN